MNEMNPKEIKTHATFESLFPINPAVLTKIEQDMRNGSYDFSQPIILATWEGQDEPVCIDGHTRLQAAINAGIEKVPVWLHEFDTEQEALEKAIRLQSHRRNMTDAEIFTCIETLDERRRAGRPPKELAQRCANFSEDALAQDAGEIPESSDVPSKGKSAEALGELLGISTRKVEQARTVLDHADAETLEAAKKGDISANRAYQETQKKRRETKIEAQSKNSAEQPAPEPTPEVVAGTEEHIPAQNDLPHSLGRSVTVYLPDWQYNGLVSLCSGYIESHVSEAVSLYLESLGIRPPQDDDDEEFFDPEEYDNE